MALAANRQTVAFEISNSAAMSVAETNVRYQLLIFQNHLQELHLTPFETPIGLNICEAFVMRVAQPKRRKELFGHRWAGLCDHFPCQEALWERNGIETCRVVRPCRIGKIN
jgi:hypothetical protein